MDWLELFMSGIHVTCCFVRQCSYGTTMGTAILEIASTYALPRDSPEPQSNGKKVSAKKVRRSKAAIIFAEDLRQALQKAPAGGPPRASC